MNIKANSAFQLPSLLNLKLALTADLRQLKTSEFGISDADFNSV